MHYIMQLQFNQFNNGRGINMCAYSQGQKAVQRGTFLFEKHHLVAEKKNNWIF